MSVQPTNLLTSGLVIAESHPVQYHAPVYRYLYEKLGLPIHVVYGSDFSVRGYLDEEFSAELSWDVDLTTGYPHSFLRKVEEGGGRTYENVDGEGLPNVVSKLKPVVGMVLGYYSRFDRLAFATFRKSNVPIIFRGEPNDSTASKHILKRMIRYRYLRSFYGRCAAFCYIGEKSRLHYERLGVPSKSLCFSPYCVPESYAWSKDSSRIREDMRATLGVTKDEKVVLYCGKLVPRKGVETLLSAMVGVSNHAKCHFLFVGEGRLRTKMEAQTNAFDNISVTYTGFVNQSNLTQYYLASDVLCLPSTFGETWGLVVNEAMMSGLPVVVSNNVGCAPDLIEPGETGFVFEAGSTSSLVVALLDAINLTKKDHTSVNCRTKVSTYSVSNAASGILNAYESTIATKGR